MAEIHLSEKTHTSGKIIVNNDKDSPRIVNMTFMTDADEAASMAVVIGMSWRTAQAVCGMIGQSIDIAEEQERLDKEEVENALMESM